MLQFILTADGSKTLFNPEIGENYHSKHGALQESTHVFLKSGLCWFLDKNPADQVAIVEVGLGTGLNFLLTADYCTSHQIVLDYTGIEAYPLPYDIISQTGYDQYLSEEVWHSFLENYADSQMHTAGINNYCRLHTAPCKLIEFKPVRLYDIIYFDAFASARQPEMWDERSLNHISRLLKAGGLFVTYAITGNLKRSLKALGFKIEKAPGAPGKREMLRAVKAVG